MKRLLALLLTFPLCIFTLFCVGCYTPQKDAVNIKYYAEASQLPPFVLSGQETIALVPEPAATALQANATKQGKTLYRLDLQELYDSEQKAYPQAVLLVKKSVLGSHAGIVQTLENAVSESVGWIKTNTEQAVSAISNNGTTTLNAKALNSNAIDGCKIYWQGASNAKQSVKDYINSIIEIDSAKAKVVEDKFFDLTSSQTSQKAEYVFAMPDGAPALSVAKLMNDGNNLGTNKTIDYQVVSTIELRNHIVLGTADFIVCPVNMASQLYTASSNTDHYVMVSVLTHGNFYIISTEQITINDLAGKQVAVPMPNAVPDWTFRMVLNKHGLTYQTVE